MRAFLFDLDGTLLDTAADMGVAFNGLLEQEGKAPLPLSQIRPLISGGSPALLKLGFDIEKDHPDYESLRKRFLNLYQEQLRIETKLFEGMDEVLKQLDQKRIPWGIVTNKPTFLTEPLLDHCGLTPRLKALVCGDTLSERKPHPAPIFYACDVMGVPPHQTVFVGDHINDIKAGNGAGVTTVVANYGYISEGENGRAWGANQVVEQPRDLLEFLAGLSLLDTK